MQHIKIRKQEYDDFFIAERLELVRGRLKGLPDEYSDLPAQWKPYMQCVYGFLTNVLDVFDAVSQGSFEQLSLQEMQEINKKLYADITGEHYWNSFACPDYAYSHFSCGGKIPDHENIGIMASFLYSELYSLIGCAFEQKAVEITMYLELFLELYGLVQMSHEDGNSWLYRNIKESITDFYHGYCEFFVERRTREMLDPDCDFAVDIINHADLSDLRYLYRFGEYISENEIRTAEYLNTLEQEKIDAMARTFTEGFRMGYINGRMDMSGKRCVNIRYVLGFERLVKAEMELFSQMGLQTVIYRKADLSFSKRQSMKIGFYGGAPNEQFYYDHRMDMGLYLDQDFFHIRLAAQKKVWETYRQKAAEYAGPACMETFGEKPFVPKTLKHALVFDKKQQELSTQLQMRLSLLQDEYIPGDQCSFTIIAYPVPSIGDQYQEIFRSTVSVNTLPQEEYRQIQQKLIDALDRGAYVRVTGRGENKTDMRVMLHPLTNPEKETNFENCTADVNIPVGEVFTSPVLAGTDGILHVSGVYLEGLYYKNLTITFKDGMIVDYQCDNYKGEPEKNKQYIKENVLFQHETLPIGEFAIGTNTTAYRMGKDFGIFNVLPILIAEKTGPHFALGDTCYSMCEDHAVYNPDGKEIIARDNECSVMRKTEREKAYFNCHTDITIPYDELGMIAVYIPKENGVEELRLIDGGKFILPGTEKLNQPL